MVKPKSGNNPDTVSQQHPHSVQHMDQHQVTQQWSGPLPPPAALEQFNQIIPGSAERILAMVEKEQEHRINTDKSALIATIADTQRGHYLGSLISLSSILGCVYSVYIGASAIVSVALVGIPVLAMVKAIVGNKLNNKP